MCWPYRKAALKSSSIELNSLCTPVQRLSKQKLATWVFFSSLFFLNQLGIIVPVQKNWRIRTLWEICREKTLMLEFWCWLVMWNLLYGWQPTDIHIELEYKLSMVFHRWSVWRSVVTLFELVISTFKFPSICFWKTGNWTRKWLQIKVHSSFRLF